MKDSGMKLPILLNLINAYLIEVNKFYIIGYYRQ